MKPASRDRASFARDSALLGGAILLFYGMLLWAPLISDDQAYILRFPSVAGAWTGFRAFLDAGPNSEQFEPLVHLIHRALFALSGARPLLYRLTSLLIHWANAVLALALFSRILKDRRLAFLAALLFALFPASVEVLAGSTNKKHLLVAFFTLSALLLTERRSWKPAARVAAGWVLFALALACKETAVVLPALVAARKIAGRREAERAGAAENVALFGGWTALLAGYVLLRRALPARGIGPWAGGSLVSNLLTSGKILSWSLAHLAVPWPLSLEHALSAVSLPPAASSLAAACAAAACAGAAAVMLLRGGRAGFAAAWVLVALAPFLNLVPYLNFSLVMDRYLYLASAGFFLLAAIGLEAAQDARGVKRLKDWAPAALLAVAAVYAATGAIYAALFSNPVELWANAVRRAPRNPRAHEAYGFYLAREGRDDEAAAELRRSIELDSGFDTPYEDLARLESRRGNANAAAEAAGELVRWIPTPEHRAEYGVYLLKAGRAKESADALRRASADAPDELSFQLDLGYAELAQKRWKEADEAFEAAATAPSLRANALAGRGEAALGAGRPAEAAPFLHDAVDADPWNVRAVELLAEAELKRGRRKDALAVLDAALDRVETAPVIEAPVRAALRAELSARRERAAHGR